MSPAEIQIRINLARREMEHWQGILRDKACTNCKEWQHRGCGLAGGVEPPAEVVKAGCDSWAWDLLPF